MPSAVDKDEEEEDMQALTELQTPDIPESEEPDVVDAEYDVRHCRVFSPYHSKVTFNPRKRCAHVSLLSLS